MKNYFKAISHLRGLLKLYLNFKIYGKPVSVDYDLTYQCNLTCEHCYFYKNYSKDETERLTESDWEAIFLKHKAEGVREVYMTGGEPLLRPNLIDVANRIFGTGRVTIVTNGTIPIRSDWKNVFFVSLDGDEEANDRIRGKGTTKRILKNIRQDKRVLIATTITKSNYTTVNSIYAMAKEAGVRGLTFAFYTAKFDDPNRLEESEIDSAIAAITELRKQDPAFVLITPKMLEIIKSKAHVKNCILRQGFIRSYTPSMEQKKPCVFGEGIDCGSCGCGTPITAHALKCFDWETTKMLRDVYSRGGNSQPKN
jgi:molybdenum cofactor biosynthesis enzyme MoaA